MMYEDILDLRFIASARAAIKNELLVENIY